MSDKLKGMLMLAGALAALGGGGAAIAGATGGGDDEGREDDAGESREQVSDAATVDRARAAALRAAGGGTVTEVERADERESGFEVEVEQADGSFVEVALDESFDAVSVERDDD